VHNVDNYLNYHQTILGLDSHDAVSNLISYDVITRTTHNLQRLRL